MKPVEVLRALAVCGIGLAPADGGLGVYTDGSRADAPTLTPELRGGVVALKAVLLLLVTEAAVRPAWRVPDEAPLGPQLATMLAWLLEERATFGRDEWRRWLEIKSWHVDDGALVYVADILATEAVARERLRERDGLEAAA